MPAVRATASGCDYRRCREKNGYGTGNAAVASSAGRHRWKYTPTTGAWVPCALDVRTESHSCCWECSASTSRPARPSAGSAGSKWRPIASPRTSPKNIRVLAGSTCRRRSCGRSSRQKATVEVGGDKRPRGERTATSFRQSFWHSLPLMSPVSLGALRCLQLVNEDAQQRTGCSFDQFLPPWRQRGHRVVRGQFAYKVVNACLRARLHSLDDANIDPPPPILFVHIASLHEPPYRPLLLLPSTVRLPSVVLFSKTCAPSRRHIISHHCRLVSGATQTLVWLNANLWPRGSAPAELPSHRKRQRSAGGRAIGRSRWRRGLRAHRRTSLAAELFRYPTRTLLRAGALDAHIPHATLRCFDVCGGG